jgi:hypothetical protein
MAVISGLSHAVSAGEHTLEKDDDEIIGIAIYQL